MPLSPGRRLGPYEIASTIGSGGMGEVYEARDTRLNRRVALKILRPELLADPQSRRRFEREARALSALSHPNICTVFDVGREDGIDFIVMEYIEGQTLGGLLDRQGLPEPAIVRYAEQIAEALAEAHEHGVLHRDIKPQNVMVTPRGHVKVLDFGLSRAIGGEPPGQAATMTALSDAAVVLGTAPYMSPEQVRGEVIDARSDAFSLGCLVYEALAGRTPFQRRTPVETMSAIFSADPVPLARIAPQTTAEVQRIVRKCLEKDKSRRYQTLRDVATDLEALRRDSNTPLTAG
jgi:serine/threonine protein kinase